MTIVKQRSFFDSSYLAISIGCIIIAAIVGSYLLYIYNTPSFSKAAAQVLDWLSHPLVSGTLPSPASYATMAGLLAFDLLLGLSAMLVVLPKDLQKSSPHLVFSASMLVGLALVGVLAIISVESNNLTRESILVMGVAIIGFSNYLNYRQHRQTVASFLRDAFRPASLKSTGSRISIKPAIIAAVIVMYALIFFQATSFPVTEWDALVYHANLAKLWYENAPDYKIIAGPSVGIQMSASYPPLFPAIGAAHYVVAGEFNDLYLKVVAPLLSLLTLSLTYLVAKMHLKSVPRISILFLLSMPFFVMYSIWPTNYSTLMVFTTASILFLVLGVQKGSMRYFALAGLFIGLAMLSSYLGIILAAFAAIVLGYRLLRMLASRSQLSRGGAVLFELKHSVLPLFLMAASLAGLWYVFNLFTVGDPVFPYGGRFFQSEYLDQEVLAKSIDQITQNALGYWGQSTGSELFQKQVISILLDPHLYSLGILPAVIGFALAISRRNAPMVILGVWMSVLILSQLVQGWFWLRTFTLMLPAVAILSAYSIDTVLTTIRQKNLRLSGAALKYPVYAVLFVAIIYPGFIIGMVGVNHPTILYGISKELPYDFMHSWKNVGDDRAILAGVFMGEAEAWSWMNDNIPGNSKIATLDAREYHVRSDMFFYLDGKEAVPLLDMTDPSEIRQYLVDYGVRYIWAPGNTFRTAAAYPLINEMPLFKYLGTAEFPIVTVYDAWIPPSIIYDVFPSQDAAQPLTTFLTGTTKQGESEIVEANNVRGGLLFIHTPDAGKYKISVTYRDSGTGNVDFNLEENNNWQIGHSVLKRADSSETKVHAFHIDAKANGISVIGIYSYHDDFEMQHVTVSKAVQSSPSIDFSGVIVSTGDSAGPVIINDHQEQTRLFVNTPNASLYEVNILYHDLGTGSIDFNLQNEDGTWQTGYSTLELRDSGDIKVHSFYVSGRPDSVIPIGIFAPNSLTIQKATIQSVADSEPSIQLSGIVIRDGVNVVRTNDTEARLLVDAPLANENYQIDIFYQDIGSSPVDFNIQNEDGTWSTISTVARTNSGESKTHTFHISSSEASSVVIGMYAYESDFYIENTRIAIGAALEPVIDVPEPEPVPEDDGNTNSPEPEPIVDIPGNATETEEPLVDIVHQLENDDGYVVQAGDVNNRLLLPTDANGIYRVAIAYNDAGLGPVDFNLQNEDGTWQGPYSTLVQSNSTAAQMHVFYIDGRANSTVTLGVYAYESSLVIESIELAKIKEVLVPTQGEGRYRITASYNDTGTAGFDLVRLDNSGLQTISVPKADSNALKSLTVYATAEVNSTVKVGVYPNDDSVTIEAAKIKDASLTLSGTTIQNGAHIIQAGDINPRLLVDTLADGLYEVTITYRDDTLNPLDFNLQNADGTWDIGYSTIVRTGTGEAKIHTFYIDGKANSTATMGLYAYDGDIALEELQVRQISNTGASAQLTGVLVQDGTYIVKAGDVNGRLLVNTPDERYYRVTITYNSSTYFTEEMIDFNLQNEDGTWIGMKKTKEDALVNKQALFVFWVEGRGSDSPITIGIFSPHKEFQILNLNID